MRRSAGIGLVLLHVMLALACGPRWIRPAWPDRGTVAYVSKSIAAEGGDEAPSISFPNPRPNEGGVTPGRPVPSLGSNPLAATRLPACEAVEVRGVHKSYLRVRWLDDSATLSRLEGDWRSIIHRTREECLESLAKRKQVP